MRREPFFAGAGLDRADALRADAERLQQLLTDPLALELVWDETGPAVGPDGKLQWRELTEPALFLGLYPQLAALNVMGLKSPETAVLAAVIYNAFIIIALIPLALKGVKYREVPASRLLAHNLLVYGVGGMVAPFICIKLLDLVLGLFI